MRRSAFQAWRAIPKLAAVETPPRHQLHLELGEAALLASGADRAHLDHQLASTGVHWRHVGQSSARPELSARPRPTGNESAAV